MSDNLDLRVHDCTCVFFVKTSNKQSPVWTLNALIRKNKSWELKSGRIKEKRMDGFLLLLIDRWESQSVILTVMRVPVGETASRMTIPSKGIHLRLLRNHYDHNAPQETDHHFIEQWSVKFMFMKSEKGLNTRSQQNHNSSPQPVLVGSIFNNFTPSHHRMSS